MEDMPEFLPSRNLLLDLSESKSTRNTSIQPRRRALKDTSLESIRRDETARFFEDAQDTMQDKMDLSNPSGCQQRSASAEDIWALPPLPKCLSSSMGSQASLSRPRPSLTRFCSLDNLMTYREELAQWTKASSGLKHSNSAADIENDHQPWASRNFETLIDVDCQDVETPAISSSNTSISPESDRGRFRYVVAEVGFCFTIAATQFLAEYLISGFAIELPRLVKKISPVSMGFFWPASLLSLLLSATLLVFARLSDMYGGYPVFMFGVVWLVIWTLIPGFYYEFEIVLDVARAMQGIAIAAYTPSTFVMVGSIYPEGPRKNFVLGLYAGCAPLGFFSGLLAAGALPNHQTKWYFFIAAMLSGVAFVTAFLTVPKDRTDRQKLDLQMDWIGAFFITSGLILVAYALAAEPYANEVDLEKTGFSSPIVIGPLVSGFVCLLFAFWYEGWYARCPLLPFDFFAPRSVLAFSISCLCFYASYGVWLYSSAEFFQSDSGTTQTDHGVAGINLAIWYTPTAIGGIILCIVGGSLMHIVPIMILLLVSALAWIAAPLLFAVAPLPIDYWSYVLPSMICATIGIDITFTVSIVFISSIQPTRYQGLSGAVCSILVNLAMSFALSISEIVSKKAKNAVLSDGHVLNTASDRATNWSFRASFIYAAASAGLGLAICILFVRMSRSVVRQQLVGGEELRPLSSDSTLVAEGEES